MAAVLIVDDAVGTRRGLGQLLELRGYQTREAINGSDALDILLTSASNGERLASDGSLDDEVTLAVRANDTTDIWNHRGSSYTAAPSRPFRTAELAAVRPFDRYADDFSTATARHAYGELWSGAERQVPLAYRSRSEEAYRAAMRWVWLHLQRICSRTEPAPARSLAPRPAVGPAGDGRFAANAADLQQTGRRGRGNPRFSAGALRAGTANFPSWRVGGAGATTTSGPQKRSS